MEKPNAFDILMKIINIIFGIIVGTVILTYCFFKELVTLSNKY